MAEMTIDVIESEEAQAVDPVVEATAVLKEKFPSLQDDTREGYQGLMVPPENLLEVAQTLRDELGFDYLSSVTGVDLIDDNKMEVVYHTYSIAKARRDFGFEPHVSIEEGMKRIEPDLIELAK